ncbi:MAG: hypothetical protein HQ503_14125 [Rhodospirillales bacterium]|nr:hypothetical protein [Rhodospirillales bacterium]
MDIFARRGHIKTAPNPDQKLDYVVTLSGELGSDVQNIAGCRIEIRYVPDKHILTPVTFTHYLDTLNAFDWTHLEEAATTILDDLSNELVARWIQVKASRRSGSEHHQVLLEDKQPLWNNPQLLAGLGPL